jgi:hypothetical protein
MLPAALRDILDRLRSAGIPYMLTGSFASAWHGLPRATQDLDLVIAPSPTALRRFVEALPPAAFYVDGQAAMEALARESQFNVIDLADGWNVGLICRRSRPFSRVEFDRRVEVDLDGTPLWVAAAEDVVLSKLESTRSGQRRAPRPVCLPMPTTPPEAPPTPDDAGLTLTHSPFTRPIGA